MIKNGLTFLLLLTPGLMAAQTAPADTLRPPRSPFQGTLPDSLAAAPTPAGTLQLQGQEQPVRPFLTVQEQLRTVAGVQVTPYSGAPGSLAAVRIRGAASLAGNPQPLYVVDGVPALAGPVEVIDSRGYLPLNDIAPHDFNPLLALPAEDIDSVVVLKGPLETARYGAQGQNGVIEITTRRGHYQRAPQVSYSGAGGVQFVPYRYDLLSAREYAIVANEGAALRGRSGRFSPAQVAALGVGTNWQNELLRTAAVQEHHLSLAGGSATGRGYLGADYLDQSGVVINSRLRRYSLSANLEQRLGGHLRLTLGLLASQTNARQQESSLVLNMLTADPTQPPRDAQGNFTGNGSGSGRFFNPLHEALQLYQDPRQRRLLTHATLEAKLATGLYLELNGGLETTRLHVDQFSDFVFSASPVTTLSGVLAGERDDEFRKLTLRPVLRFGRTLAGRHTLTAQLEGWHQTYHTSYDTREYLGGQLASRSYGDLAQRTLSYQAAVGYSYAGRYEVQGSLRRDASSALPSDQYWIYLPAAQLTWHAGQEAFLRQRGVRQLDVWAGWGQTSGNGNPFSQSFFNVQLPGSTLNVFNTERTTQEAAGLRLGLRRLRFLLEVYRRRTTVEQVSIFGSVGQGLGGQVLNRGVELTVAADWTAGPVQATTTLAAAANHNEDQDFLPYSGNRYGQRLTAGQPLSSFYGLRYEGVNAATGQAQYQTATGGVTSNSNEAAVQNLGSGLPRQLLSLSQTLRWRRLTAQTQLDGMFGYQVSNNNLLLLDAANGYDNSTGRVRGRWEPGGPAGSTPGAAPTYLQLPLSSYTLQSGSHVRLTTLTLSMRVWERATRSVSVWIGGHNLLVFSAYRGFDPNVSSGGANNKAAGLDASAYPVARTVSVGVRATL